MRVHSFLDTRTGLAVRGIETTAGRWEEVRLENGGFARTGAEVVPGRALPAFAPTAIFCAGVNYADHAREFGSTQQAYPTVFMKNPGSLAAHGEDVRLPRFLRSDAVDYEAELAVVIGRACRNVRAEDALSHVLGYCCANDVSARDWQKEKGGGQWCRGKSFDTFCPLGPCLVTADEIPDPQTLAIRFRLNSEVMQSAHTSQMQFRVADLIAFLSGSSTLPAGSVILTGTPSGVGMARTPPRYLRPGDVMEVEIERIGVLRNPVTEEIV